jgi:putative colanic acid biosynthesis UDP-glucose lipid carrier transferase
MSSIIGYSPEAIQLKNLLNQETIMAIIFLDIFLNKQKNIEIKGKLEKLKSFVLENEIDEIYCSFERSFERTVKQNNCFFRMNIKTIKFISRFERDFFKEITN